MSNEYTYFVDFGSEHIVLLAAKIKNKQLVDIPIILKKTIKITLQRQQTAIEQPENFEALLMLISEAEQKLHTNISSIILTTKSKAMCLFFTKKKIDFKKQQRVTQIHKEKLITDAIKDFYEKTDGNYSILDVIPNNFILDQYNNIKNPYKMSCQLLLINATIIGIKNNFTTFLGKQLENFKLHIDHYISPCVAIYSLLKNSLSKTGNFLFIDLGSNVTEYCISQNDCITHLNAFELGGVDLTRDIAKEMKIYIHDADTAKKKICDDKLQKTEDKATRFAIKQIEKTANARFIEIIGFIFETIKNNKDLRNLSFKKIYIFGGNSMYKNAKSIVSGIFNNPNVEILDISCIFESDILYKKIKEIDLNNDNLQLFCAVNFYINNINMYKNAKRGFLFEIPSKISCFLKDMLY